MSSKQLEFVTISSSIDPSFWSKFSEIKLNEDKLDEVQHPIWGYFSNINNNSGIPIVEVNSTSFNNNFESRLIYIPFHGKTLNVNTIEKFKECDKTKIINDIGLEVFENIENGKALECPSLLNQFFILSFMDLKKFHFYYWFAFPVPHNLSILSNDVKNITEDFTLEQLEIFWNNFCELENTQKPYFLVSIADGIPVISNLKSGFNNLNEDNYSNYYFGFYDISLLKDSPGSTLRNYITLILNHCAFLEEKSLNFLSLRIDRGINSKLSITGSLIFNLSLPVCQPSISDFIKKNPSSAWVGWEKNERGKMGPRFSNMKSFLDPAQLAENSVDLNLKLMKWRLLSNIDLEKIKKTKYLLLGSGTLGCSVSRILLGWGARFISFVDNSVVSYSNPVRQSLFTFEDSKTSKPKSLAAAENLQNIFPGVKSKSYQLSIPMPGHPVGEIMLDQVKSDVETLTNLIQEHDIIFLLMDSRESRWLPTLLGMYFDKVVINAALGFDSYLVMRHGVKVDLDEFKVRQHMTGFKSLKGNSLGCYFCNDVTAPGNSLKDRTLDQQCTVTRPGVSAIAGALTAELAISILQHKEGAKAPAFYQIGSVTNTYTELDYQCVLGLVPHSIRGHLSSFSQVLPATQRYQQCVACSDVVQNAYGEEGFDFLLKVFQNSEYLEKITGLSELSKAAEEAEVWELSDEEEIECTTYSENQLEIASNVSYEQNKSISETIVQCDHYNIETLKQDESKDEFNDSVSAKDSGKFEDVQSFVEVNLNHSNDQSVSEKSSFSGLTKDILKKLVEITMVNNDADLNPNSIEKIDSVEELPKKISSNQSIKMSTSEEKLSFESSLEEKKHAEDEKLFISNNFSVSKIPSKEIFTLKKEVIQSSHSVIEYPSSLSSLENVPNELIPILEKQRMMNSSNFNIIKQDPFKFRDDLIKSKMSIKSKFIEDKEIENPKSILNDSTPNKDIVTVKSKVSLLFSSDSQSSANDNVIKNEFKGFGKLISHLTKSLKSNATNITTHFVTSNNLQSTDSEPKDISLKQSQDEIKLKEDVDEKKEMLTLLVRNLTSSNSLYMDEPFHQKEITSDNKIITLTKPQDMYSSGSLTSANLGIDESMYYLAETDKSKTSNVL